ncbi:Rieske 2Fe-2S domain-containing protein [Altererythrobacter salegens]|uniref:Rieske 2Fe-2S domain-containing protein n=1 Tax=Croceibacterium salegens TaxID=1737568 RepID=A0A6I4SZ93_9SPHN|nr:aromatic ring-hydroxylating dioxygenase subunit alpha [Croceibacterium salegens]MXO61364.1 Rieske 2Fe-2S domain-containing protein [Croceibacterium salegens]
MTYVRNAWYVAAWEQDLPADAPAAMSILGEPIVLWRAGEKLVAMEDRCVHRHAPLSLGRCEGASLRCMYHGLRFDADGRCVEIPGQELIPPTARVKTYPALAKHSWVWVWMGDPALADEALVPPAVGYDDPDYILGHGFLDYEAEARLINDNLLDFSHLSYVHAQSFGTGPEFAGSLPRITPLPRGIRYERWLEGTFGAAMRKSDVPLDSWQTYDFLIPGVLLMWSANYPPGTAKALGHSPPEKLDAIAGLNFTSQAVTPTGEGTARYFFSWGPHCKYGDEAMRDGMMALADRAFGEDKTMIEAQQKVIARDPERPVMPTAHDKGVTLFNRLVQRLAAEEAEARAAAA